MDKYIRENLEGFLSGQLSKSDSRKFEAKLNDNPKLRHLVSGMSEVSTLFGSLELQDSNLLLPPPGLKSRIRLQLEEERSLSFWEAFVNPLLLRRIVYVSCTWLMLLVGAGIYQIAPSTGVSHQAEAILTQLPDSTDYYVRMGSDINLNRDTMLAAVLISRSSTR